MNKLLEHARNVRSDFDRKTGDSLKSAGATAVLLTLASLDVSESQIPGSVLKIIAMVTAMHGAVSIYEAVKYNSELNFIEEQVNRTK